MAATLKLQLSQPLRKLRAFAPTKRRIRTTRKSEGRIPSMATSDNGAPSGISELPPPPLVLHSAELGDGSKSSVTN